MTAQSQPPRLRELREVIPVGQTLTGGDWAITCLTVARYDDGFRVTFRVFRAGLWPCSPELALAVSDDQGGEYRPWGGGANSAANWNDCDCRLAHNCTPALDGRARELRLAVAEVQLLEPDESRHRERIAERFPGPWVFTVALPPPA